MISSLLFQFLLTFTVCCAGVNKGIVKIDGKVYRLENDSCIRVNIPSGWHRVELLAYGYQKVDTLFKGDSILLVPEIYHVDSVVTVSTRGSGGGNFDLSRKNLSLTPVPMFHDPVLVAKYLPFVLVSPYDEIENNDLDYSAALGHPDENALLIDGIPLLVFPVYPRPLVPLPLIRDMEFSLLDIPLENGWSVSSQVNVQLPGSKREKVLYIDPFGTFSLTNGKSYYAYGIQVYSLTPVILLLSKGKGNVTHLDLFLKRSYKNAVFSGFTLAEVSSLKGILEPEATKIFDAGVKLSRNNLTYYLAVGFYNRDQYILIEKAYNYVAGVHYNSGLLSIRTNFVGEFYKHTELVGTPSGEITETGMYKRNSVFLRVWENEKLWNLSVKPYIDGIFYKMSYRSAFMKRDSTIEFDSFYPGIKLSLDFSSPMKIYLSSGITNQFFALIKEYDPFQRRCDKFSRIAYGILNMKTKDMSLYFFYRRDITDSTRGFGVYQKFNWGLSRRTKLQAGIWGMYSYVPPWNYGLNVDAFLLHRWNNSTHLTMRITKRFPLHLFKGGSEAPYFRTDIMVTKNFHLKGHPATLYMGVFNLLSKKPNPGSINYPIPMLSLEVKL